MVFMKNSKHPMKIFRVRIMERNTLIVVQRAGLRRMLNTRDPLKQMVRMQKINDRGEE